MARRPFSEKDEPFSLPGPYDAPDDAEPWFLPDDAAGPDLPPDGRALRGGLFQPEAWLQAQGALSGDLAGACLAFGRLDARMAAAGEGMVQRLALQEVADLCWLAGSRVGLERLSLFMALRVGAGDDGAALAEAAWAVRRLTGAVTPQGAGDWAEGLAAFLGAGGGAGGEAVLDLAEVMAGTGALHPLTRAALLFHAWRMAGAERRARDIEGAVMAARLAGGLGRGMPFVPLALGSGAALRGQGGAEARLAAFLRGAEQAALAALMRVDRMAEWEGRAAAALRGRSGRTPAGLMRVFARWPLVSAPMAEAQTGASRAAVQRNLDLMAGQGIIREITGQGRYRIWTAAV